ncbi:unnamed protein product [Psylliodes chrysocephalus]|uniref:Uncharacterized protein n=1 Tax=Psylliodes chrysocephalus TaxID=3402493 RepID=A0A9P0D7I3_9CUCU|nr:unnamed protein product [Psylliodes chrysocephala]
MDGMLVKYGDIRQIIFLKGSNEVQFKYSLKDEVKFVTLENLRLSRNIEIVPVYTKRQEIPLKKYDSLLEMCEKNIIDEKYHEEYKSLIAKDTPVTLPESDEEDTISNYE